MRLLLVAVAVVGLIGSAQGPVKPGPGFTSPQLISQQHPKYTSAGMLQKIQGSVTLEAVVGVDGSVTDVRIIKSLDKIYGLDDEAIAAARQWKFRPGQDRTGTPVAMIVNIELTFQIRGEGAPNQTLRAPHPASLDQAFVGDAQVLGSPGLTTPVLVRAIEPKYTSQAMLAKIQGTVEVDIVIGVDGRVARARIARSLDPASGLDETALAAAKEWTFEPGKMAGQPVPVAATITLAFRLH